MFPKSLLAALGGWMPGAKRLQRTLHRHRSEAVFRKEFDTFSRLSKGIMRLPLPWEERWPCLTDRTASTTFDTHYVYHCAWATRVVARIRPQLHIDIASSLHFCAQLSAFCPIGFFDYRPARLYLANLTTGAADLMRLPFANESVRSLSCMHVVEHVGLGRYGDPLDPDGDLKAVSELKRVVAPGGSLLLVVPVGKPRIQFNAHRIYAYEQIWGCFAGWRLKEFALIPDEEEGARLIVGADSTVVNRQRYGCGCFWLQKAST